MRCTTISPPTPLAALVLVATLLLGGNAAVAEVEVEVAVIAHPGVAQDTLSKSQLLDYYTGDIQLWPDGARVTVKELKEKGPVREAFYQFLGKRPSRMKSIWLRNMLSGEGEPPESVETEEELVAKVAATPGALGFVSRAQVTDRVRVLLAIVPDESEPAEP